MPGQLVSLGVDVSRMSLPAGDYDVGGGALVERKRVRDLHLSLVDGRYWRQMGTLRRDSSWPLLLVEGRTLTGGPVGLQAIRGVLVATLRQGIGIIRSDDAEDSAAWLHRLAARLQHDHHRYRPYFAQIPRSPPDSVRVAMLSAVPGISTVTAQTLPAKFGTISGVVAAGEESWRTVPGMGVRRCRALADARESH